MKRQTNICQCCGVDYYYYHSGASRDGVPFDLVDEKYCPDCMVVVKKALSKVKKKVIKVRVDASGEIDLKTLLDYYATLMVRRVYPTLFAMDGNDPGEQCIGVDYIGVDYKKTLYFVTTWKKKNTYTIMKEVRYDRVNKRYLDGRTDYKKKAKVCIDPNWVAPTDEPHTFPKFSIDGGVIPLAKPVGLSMFLERLRDEDSNKST